MHELAAIHLKLENYEPTKMNQNFLRGIRGGKI